MTAWYSIRLCNVVTQTGDSKQDSSVAGTALNASLVGAKLVQTGGIKIASMTWTTPLFAIAQRQARSPHTAGGIATSV